MYNNNSTNMQAAKISIRTRLKVYITNTNVNCKL